MQAGAISAVLLTLAKLVTEWIRLLRHNEAADRANEREQGLRVIHRHRLLLKALRARRRAARQMLNGQQRRQGEEGGH